MQSETRPRGIGIIGWGYVFFGWFLLFVAGIGIVIFAYSVLASPESVAHVFGGGGGTVISMMAMYVHLIFVAPIQILMAFLLLFAGVGLLRMRPWSRPFVELLTWAAFACVMLFGIFWVLSWAGGMPAPSGSGGTAPESGGLRAAGAVFSMLITICIAAPLGLALRYLRLGSTKEAFR